MDDATQREIEATHEAMLALRVKRPRLRGDALLNAATEIAGYNVDTTVVEMCNGCGALYSREDQGEYIDPFDHTDLLDELKHYGARVRSLRRLFYCHFCDFNCLMTTVLNKDRPFRG